MSVGPARSPRQPGIEGLRAVAAGSVLIYHVWKLAAPGGQAMDLVGVRSIAPHLWNGVTLFFVLSGFLLFRPYATALTRGAALPKIRRYLGRRALRILPAYWVILFVVGVVLDTASLRTDRGIDYEGAMTAGQMLLHGALLQNYSEDTLFTGIAPAWSLAVELVWYLALPLLALLAAAIVRRSATRAGRLRALLAPIALLIVVGFSGKLAALLVLDWPRGATRNFWGLADMFAYGMVVAVVSVAVEHGDLRLPAWWRRAAAGALLTLVALAVVFGDSNYDPGGPLNHAYNVAVGIVCALLVALVVLPDERPAGRRWLVPALDSRLLTVAGAGSYSLFLWHEPTAEWLRNHGLTDGGWAGFAVNLVLVAVISGVLAALTYRLVERPAMRVRTRADRRIEAQARAASAGAAP